MFDKVSGNLIGFIDPGDPMTNFACLSEEDPIASHALAFLVRGLCADLKHIMAYFFTGNLTSFQIMPLFLRTVAVLEMQLSMMEVLQIASFFDCIQRLPRKWILMWCIKLQIFMHHHASYFSLLIHHT